MAEVVGEWPPHIEPRVWQDQARAEFESKVVYGRQSNFLCVVTPGGGKTLYALMVMHDLLSSGVIERVVVVCPTSHLKSQWITAASSVGLHLDDRKNAEGWETADFHGSVLTYQQVAACSHLHRRAASRQKTLVVLDEVHHAGGDLSWGSQLAFSFGEAEARLLLTGTPWRDPKSEIPFVDYDDEFCSVSDFEYGYAESIADGVCGSLVFRGYDGEINWHSVAGDYQTASLKEEIDDSESSRRLRTALDPSGNWLRGVIRDADLKLVELRGNGHADAAGLVIAKDQDHAKAIARMMLGITGEDPVVAISEDQDSSEHIARFRSGYDKWIIAVKMISEGVDIPRLRVGVYATNTIAKLFFNQVSGRFVRLVPGIDEQTAYLYIPSDERLLGFAKTIMEAQIHELREVLEEKLARDRNEAERLERQPDLFLGGTSGDAVLDEIIAGEKAYTPAELLVAQELKRANPPWKFIPDEIVAEIVRYTSSGPAPAPSPNPPVSTAPPKNRRDILSEQRRLLNKRAYAVAMQMDIEPGRVNGHLNHCIGKKREDWLLADYTRGFEVLGEVSRGSSADAQAL